jgi:hypothetical protein
MTKRATKNRRTLFDRVSDFYVSSFLGRTALGVSLPPFFWLLQQGARFIQNPEQFKPELSVTDPGKLAIAFAWSQVISHSTALLTRYKKPRVRNFLKAYKLGNALEKHLLELESSGELHETMRKYKDTLEESHIQDFHRQMAYSYFSNGRTMQGLEQAIMGYRAIQEQPSRLLTRFAPPILNLVEALSRPTKTEDQKKSLLYLRALSGLETPSQKGTLRAVKKLKTFTTSLEDTIAQGVLADEAEGPKEAHWIPFEIYINTTVPDLESVVSHVTDTRNTVYSIGTDDNRFLYLKETASEVEAKKELKLIRHFADVDAVVSDVFPVQHQGRLFLASLFAGEEYASAKQHHPDDWAMMLAYAARDFLAIDTQAKHLDLKELHEGDFSEKLAKLTEHLHLSPSFYATSREVIDAQLVKQPQVFNSDYTEKNNLWFEGRHRKIDFEKQLLVPFGIEAINFSEFSPEGLCHPLEFGDAVGYALSEYDLLLSQFQRHLELYGYASSFGNVEYAQFHFHKAQEALTDVAEHEAYVPLDNMVTELSEASPF